MRPTLRKGQLGGRVVSRDTSDGLIVSDFCVRVLCRGPQWEKGHGELAKGHNGRGVIKGQGHASL